ncbi:MAG: hypothetical protein JO048_09365 [Methylobacteriaceae bacterium]|nr:hypothetical protein [Methylobacteriaceae bacterium]
MNEVEKHYGSEGEVGSEKGAARSGSAATNPADIAKSAIDQAVSSARSGFRSVSDAAGSAGSTARETYERVTDRASDYYEGATRRASDMHQRSTAHLSRHRRNVESFVGENPIMIGVAGFAAGLLVGALIPTTRRENKLFGRYADEVREQGMRYARDLAQQGKQLVEENLSQASQGSSHGDDGAASASRMTNPSPASGGVAASAGHELGRESDKGGVRPAGAGKSGTGATTGARSA